MGTEKEARHKFPVITVRLQQFSTYSTQCKMRNTIFGRYIRQQREKMYGPQISNEQSAAAAAAAAAAASATTGWCCIPNFPPRRRRRRSFPSPTARPFICSVVVLSPAPALVCLAGRLTEPQIQGLVSWLISFFPCFPADNHLWLVF